VSGCAAVCTGVGGGVEGQLCRCGGGGVVAPPDLTCSPAQSEFCHMGVGGRGGEYNDRETASSASAWTGSPSFFPSLPIDTAPFSQPPPRHRGATLHCSPLSTTLSCKSPAVPYPALTPFPQLYPK
jgi:hypothetical protein